MKAKKRRGLVGFLLQREIGNISQFDCQSNISQVIAEEKSTIPIVNKACELSGPSRSTFLVSFSSDRSLIASTHGDHSVRVTDVKSGKCKHVLNGHPRTPWTIAFHPASNDIIATGCLGGQVRIWDLRGGGCEVWKSDDSRVIASLAFHPTDQLLVIATLNEILFWDWSKSEPFTKCKTSSSHERVRWCKFDPFGHYLYTGIANKSTIQSEEFNLGSTTNIELPSEGNLGNSSDTGHLWEQYRRVVDEITAHQRERINLQQGLLRESNVDPMLHDDIDILGASSSQTSALRNAQRYAAQVTRNSQRLFNNNTIQRTNNHTDRAPITSQIEIGRVEGPSAPDFDDTEEHMQQIHRIPNIYANNNNASPPRGLDALARAAETVSQMDSQATDQTSSLPSSFMSSTNSDSGEPERPMYSFLPNRNRVRPSFSPRYEWRTRVPMARSRLMAATFEPAELPPIPNRRPTSPSSQTPRSLTQTTLERFLNRNTDATNSILPDVNLDFLNDIQVSLPSSSAISTPITSAPSVMETTPESGTPFADFRFNLFANESEPELENFESVMSNIPSFNRNDNPHRSSVSVLRSRDIASPTTSTSSNILDFDRSRQSNAAANRRSILFSRLSSSSPLQSTASSIISRSPPVLSTTYARPQGLSMLPEVSMRVDPASEVRLASERVIRNGRSSPARDRSLMTLLEAPLPTAPNVVPRSQSSVTNTPQPSHAPLPVPPVTQSAFVGRNWEVRQALTRANDESHPATSPPARSSAHSCPVSNCIVCGGYGSFLDSYNRRRSMLFPRQHSSINPPTLNPSRTHFSSRGSILPRASLSFTPTVSSSSATVAIVTPTPTSVITAIPTSASNPAVVNAAGNSGSSGPPFGIYANANSSSEGAHQPQRLATIIETEVREAINRIRSHEVDLTHTLRDLDSLQRNLGVDPPNDDSTQNDGTSIREAPPELAASVPDSTGILEVTVENSPNGEASPGSTENEGLLAISNISSALGERIQQLDERVNSIQHRLRESMQALDRQSRYNRIDDIHRARSRRMRERISENRRARQDAINRRRLRRGNGRGITTTENGSGCPSAASVSRMTSRLQQIQAAHQSRRDRLERLERRAQLGTYRESMPWHAMRRRYSGLPRDYNVSILDDTVNRQNDLQAAINRTIAGAFISSGGEASVASNIVTLTHRIQRWDLNRGAPDIDNPERNVVVRSCKLHNDATADISQDGRFLATFVSTNRGFPDDTVLGVFSLEKDNLGQCLYTKSFGPNAISVSISPLNNYIIVGLAAKRLQWVFAPKQMVAQIYKLKTIGAGEDSMEHICDLMHPCDLDLRVHVSVNSARWLPGVGEGVAYCTNRGDLHICKPGWESKTIPSSENAEDRQQNYTRQLVMQLLRINSPRTNNSATQTTSTQGVRRTASTQTDSVALASSDSDSD